MKKLLLALTLTTTIFGQSFIAQSFSEILEGTICPELTFRCPDTPQNRAQIIHEMVLFYATRVVKYKFSSKSRRNRQS